MELTTDRALQAAQRLELAVEKLAIAIERKFAQMQAAAQAAAAESVPRSEVAALSSRLDMAMAKLRSAMLDEDAQEEAGQDEAGQQGAKPAREPQDRR